MNVLSLFCFLIALSVFLYALWKRSDVLSPARVYAMVWAISIGLAELKLSSLQHSWTMESWLVLLAGVLAFFVGTFISYVQNLNGKLVPIDQMREELREQEILAQRLFLLIMLSVGFYALSYVVVYLVKRFIPIFSLRGAASRGEFQVFGFGVVLHSIVFILFFTILYHILVKGERAKKFILKSVCVLVAVTFFLLLQRFQFIMAAVMCMTLLYYATRHLRFRNVVIYVAMLVIFFFWVSSIRTGQVLQYYLWASSKMRFAKEFAIFTEPYMYVAMNLENLATGVDRLESFTYGYYSLDFLTAITGLKHWISEYFGLVQTPFLNSSYNTYTSFWAYYRDFGVLGLVAVQLALGTGISTLYYTMRRSPSISKVAAYSVAVFIMFISFSQSPLGFLWFAYNMVMLYVILRLVTVKPQTAPEVDLISSGMAQLT